MALIDPRKDSVSDFPAQAGVRVEGVDDKLRLLLEGMHEIRLEQKSQSLASGSFKTALEGTRRELDAMNANFNLMRKEVVVVRRIAEEAGLNANAAKQRLSEQESEFTSTLQGVARVQDIVAERAETAAKKSEQIEGKVNVIEKETFSQTPMLRQQNATIDRMAKAQEGIKTWQPIVFTVLTTLGVGFGYAMNAYQSTRAPKAPAVYELAPTVIQASPPSH
jgi:hypothetical protein